MVEGGRDRGRTIVRDEGRDAARGGDFAAACQSLPASCARSVGAGMAEEGGARRRDRGAVRGRRGARVSVPGRSREVPGGFTGARAEVRTGAASREDASAPETSGDPDLGAMPLNGVGSVEKEAGNL